MTTDERQLSPTYFGMVAFLAGGAVAAALTFLFTLEKGRRTRERIRTFTGEAWDLTRQAMNDLTHQGRDLVAEAMAPIEAAYSAGREAFWREYSRGKG
jgi:gas vesicle protein